MENRLADNDVININILTLDSQRYPLRVHKEILVGLLKDEIARPSGIPRNQQVLIYSGRRLMDDRTLAHYNVENGHTIHLLTRQPNGSSSGLNPEDHPPSIILVPGHENVVYTNQIFWALTNGSIINHTNNPAIQPDNRDVMTYLTEQLTDIRRRSSSWGGGGIQVAMSPFERPLVDLLQSASSLLNNIALTVYMLRYCVSHQRSDIDLFRQRIRTYAWILRDQLWHSSPYLFELGNVMNDVIRPPALAMPPPPPPPPPPMSFPSQPERRRSRRNNGARSSNINPAGTSSHVPNTSENAEYRTRRPSDGPQDPGQNSRRRRNNM